ncbi:MAG: 4-hydroxybenzoate octaprenyltransferase [Pseudomonadota bacterium]|nr:4-hydroxybenzoate octaprenyltransferase [Pseudomonadota bacterium]
MSDFSASDIPKGNWVERMLPATARPYARMARFDRPIGTWLLLFPCWWSLALAAGGWPELQLIALFGIGAMVMRGVGCIFNDITDRDFDGSVARTRDRPIPSGAVSTLQAVIYMGSLSLIGLVILLQFNQFAIVLGAASTVLIAIYPFMKRFTYWPQFFLGLAFNWGGLLGWAVVRGNLEMPAYLLYVAGIFWTLGYDTIYAHQDKEDDALVGIRSLALKLGKRTRPYLYLFYAATIFMTAACGWTAELSWPFYVLLATGALQLAWQARNINLDDPADCLAKFKSNRLFGWLLLAAFVSGGLV